MVGIQVIGSLAREGAEAGKRRVQRHEQARKKGGVSDEGAGTVRNGDEDGEREQLRTVGGERGGDEERERREQGEARESAITRPAAPPPKQAPPPSPPAPTPAASPAAVLFFRVYSLPGPTTSSPGPG